MKIAVFKNGRVVEETLTAQEEAEFEAEQAENAQYAREQNIAKLKEKRKEILRNTDLELNRPEDRLAISEAQKTELKDYRQALRDLPDHPNFPNLQDEDWPEPPTWLG